VLCGFSFASHIAVYEVEWEPEEPEHRQHLLRFITACCRTSHHLRLRPQNLQWDGILRSVRQIVRNAKRTFRRIRIADRMNFFPSGFAYLGHPHTKRRILRRGRYRRARRHRGRPNPPVRKVAVGRDVESRESFAVGLGQN
jgi:hypothetical protein